VIEWIGIVVVSPLWGGISTQLFIQAWLAVANFLISVAGFIKGAVSRKTNALMMGAAVTGVVLHSLLLLAGFWFLTELLPFGQTRAENIVYWVFAALFAPYMLAQIPAKLRKSWRNAMAPGTLETDILKRKLGLNPD
jgi:hypothetical protein